MCQWSLYSMLKLTFAASLVDRLMDSIIQKETENIEIITSFNTSNILKLILYFQKGSRTQNNQLNLQIKNYLCI